MNSVSDLLVVSPEQAKIGLASINRHSAGPSQKGEDAG